MGMDYVRGGNTRCPSLLVGGLLLICLFLACSWWSLTSQNFELLNQVTGIEEQLKINGEELDKCLSAKNVLEEKTRNLQAGAASARVKLEQMQTKDDDLQDTLTRLQEDLKEAKKKISSLESSLTFKNTELESLKTLGEAKNKTLEALRTEKKTLSVRLTEEESKVTALKAELAGIKLLKEPSPLAALFRGKAKINQEDGGGVIVAGDHAAQAAQDENTAAEIKADSPAETENKENDAPQPDPREVAMGQTGT